jgi:hypothetical protein
MPTTIEIFDPSQILQPAQFPQDERTGALKMGANLTITKGQALAVKTSDQLGYALSPGTSTTDGTQLFVAFAKYSAVTDANSKVYFVTSPQTATPNVRMGPYDTLPTCEAGVFDPLDLTTVASPVAGVVTITPTGTITTGDVHTVSVIFGDLTVQTVTFTVGATTTATAVCNGLRTAWNANGDCVALATASGTSTFILTSASGAAINVTAAAAFSIINVVTGTGTTTNTATTAQTGHSISDILAGRPGAQVLANGFWRV